MSNEVKLDVESSRDTSPLNLNQLSDAELGHILDIEERLAEARDTKYNKYPSATVLGSSGDKPYLANVQERFARVLLLDGGRGTGKTSLLLTLVRKWHSDPGSSDAWAPQKEYRERVSKLPGRECGPKVDPVDFVQVVRILDFDPLPSGMPLLAGIIQALRPLADQFDFFAAEDACEGGDHRLLDLWQKLFRIAALGWSAVPQPKGLIEQLLDREEQVADWLKMAEQWNSFIGELLHQGKCAKDTHKLKKETVFVIMIDDVDLQVQRVQELLPALRLLYHPRIFFLVAADKMHMIDMLKLDFLGRQNELAAHRNAGPDAAIDVARMDRWATELAESAFQKVFPKRNRWRLEWLSTLEFLAFPGRVEDLPDIDPKPDVLANLSKDEQSKFGAVKMFYSYLKDIRRKAPSHVVPSPNPVPTTGMTAGDLILEFARLARQIDLPGVMPYRAAAQLWQYVMGLSEKRQPVEVLARLLSPTDRPLNSQYDNDTVDFPTTGELAPLYRRGPTELAGAYNIVLSGRPDFVFHKPGDKKPTRMSADPENRFNFTGFLLAKTMEMDNFAVDASALQWGNYLSLAWTEWPSLEASFIWTRHKYPSPYKLLEQNKTWGEFVSKRFEPRDKLEFYAYVWIYFQRRWGGWSDGPLLGPLDPMMQDFSAEKLDWDKLLTLPMTSTTKEIQESKDWRFFTLPLLARPELGLPVEVQELLLKDIPSAEESAVNELKRQRRRLVTDAVYADAMQRGEVLTKLPEDDKIEAIISAIDHAYLDGHDKKNLWRDLVENRNVQQGTMDHEGQR